MGIFFLSKHTNVCYNKGKGNTVNKLYTCIVAYNPMKNKVTWYRKVKYQEAIDTALSDAAFYEVNDVLDKKCEVILGITIGGGMYQLSLASYATYIQESARTATFFNKGRVLTAIADYKKKKNIPFDDGRTE